MLPWSIFKETIILQKISTMSTWFLCWIKSPPPKKRAYKKHSWSGKKSQEKQGLSIVLDYRTRIINSEKRSLSHQIICANSSHSLGLLCICAVVGCKTVVTLAGLWTRARLCHSSHHCKVKISCFCTSVWIVTGFCPFPAQIWWH